MVLANPRYRSARCCSSGCFACGSDVHLHKYCANQYCAIPDTDQRAAAPVPTQPVVAMNTWTNIVRHQYCAMPDIDQRCCSSGYLACGGDEHLHK